MILSWNSLYIDQAVLELRDLTAYASGVLGLKAPAITARLELI